MEDDIREQEHQKDLERIKKFRLLDDDFFQVCMQDNIDGVQLLLRIVIDDSTLIVKKVVTQKEMKNLLRHSLCLDVYAEDADGNQLDVEIQRKDIGAVPERAVYHSATLDANSLPKGEQDFRKKSETYTIMITENDVLGGNLPIYHVERVVRELDNQDFGGKSHIIYVNGAYREQDGDALKWLIHDFSCTDPDDMHFPELAERVRYFKSDSEGVKAMCKIMEDMRNESEARGREEGRAEGRMDLLTELVLSGLRKQKSLADIAESLDISEDMVIRIGKSQGVTIVP